MSDGYKNNYLRNLAQHVASCQWKSGNRFSFCFQLFFTLLDIVGCLMQLVIPKLLIPLHIPLCSLLKYDSYFLRFPCSWAWPWGPHLASEQKCGLQGKHFPLRRKNRIFIHFTYMNVNMFPEVMAVILWPWGDQRGTRRQYARERRTVRHWGTSVWLSLW